MDQTSSRSRTSSSIRRTLQVASLGRRLAAGLLDCIVLLLLVSPLIVAANGFRNSLLLVFSLVIFFAYKPVLEGLYSVTLGKLALGVRLTTIDGRELSMQDALRRNVLYLLPALFIVAVAALVQGGINVLDFDELMAILRWEKRFLFPLSVNGTVWSLFVFAVVWLVVAVYDLTSVLGGEGYRALHDLFGGTICVWQPATQVATDSPTGRLNTKQEVRAGSSD